MRYKSGEYGLDGMSEPGDSSDGNRRKAVLHSDGYRAGCTRCSLPLYRARRQKIGQHNGAHFYTIGQRKGLGIGGRKESLFVLATDVEQNVIYVGEGDNHPGLYRRALRIAPGELHWIDPLRELKTGESRRFDVRIRYRQPLQGAELFIRPDAAYLLFDEPQRGITPGQFAAWYDGDELVGSGVIAE